MTTQLNPYFFGGFRPVGRPFRDSTTLIFHAYYYVRQMPSVTDHWRALIEPHFDATRWQIEMDCHISYEWGRRCLWNKTLVESCGEGRVMRHKLVRYKAWHRERGFLPDKAKPLRSEAEWKPYWGGGLPVEVKDISAHEIMELRRGPLKDWPMTDEELFAILSQQGECAP